MTPIEVYPRLQAATQRLALQIGTEETVLQARRILDRLCDEAIRVKTISHLPNGFTMVTFSDDSAVEFTNEQGTRIASVRRAPAVDPLEAMFSGQTGRADPDAGDTGYNPNPLDRAAAAMAGLGGAFSRLGGTSQGQMPSMPPRTVYPAPTTEERRALISLIKAGWRDPEADYLIRTDVTSMWYCERIGGQWNVSETVASVIQATMQASFDYAHEEELEEMPTPILASPSRRLKLD